MHAQDLGQEIGLEVRWSFFFRFLYEVGKVVLLVVREAFVHEVEEEDVGEEGLALEEKSFGSV